jgi:putative nucleotidyltransferase with HDIG domain
MNKQEALDFVSQHVKNKNLIKHMLALGACMKGIAKHLSEDEEKWEIAGILHDVDFEETQDDLKQHPLLGCKWLEEAGVDKDIVDAVRAHGYGWIDSIPEPKNKFEWSMFCADHMTGLIIAVTLVRPSKKIEDVDVRAVEKKWKKKDFAKGTKRENITMCEEKLGISLPDFINICIKSMQGINKELGL